MTLCCLSLNTEYLPTNIVCVCVCGFPAIQLHVGGFCTHTLYGTAGIINMCNFRRSSYMYVKCVSSLQPVVRIYSVPQDAFESSDESEDSGDSADEGGRE